MRLFIRPVFAALVSLTMLTTVLTVAPATNDQAQAANARDFDAGYIISDANFYDSESMNAQSVQNFLNSRVHNCEPWRDGNPSSVTCLKDYATQTGDRPADSYCRGYSAGWQSASQIIDGVARSCGISQKVLLVMLQKESALIDHTWPSPWRYRTAMGYGCPDGAPCDAQYYGLFNQVFRAAWQYKVYAAQPNKYGYRAGQNNYIQWNPNAACGGSTVFIRNQATASLYNYTPYQPNDAAKNAGYGQGDGCSSYGNRNFFMWYSDWFENPAAPASPLVRDSASHAVYVLADKSKYYIKSMDVLGSYSLIAPIVSVPSSYLQMFQDGTPLTSAVVRDPSTGRIDTIDPSGIRHRFTTCDQMANYGLSCSAPNFDPNALSRLAVGPDLSGLGRTFSNSDLFALSVETRRHVVSWADAVAWTGTSAPGILWADALPPRPLGPPIIGEFEPIRTKTDPSTYIYTDGTLTRLRSMDQVQALTGSRLVNSTFDNSLDTLGKSTSDGTPILLCETRQFLLVDGRRIPLDSTTASTTPLKVSRKACDAIPLASVPNKGKILIGSRGNPKLFFLEKGFVRPIATWASATEVAGSSAPAISWLPAQLSIADVFPEGDPVLPALYLAKSSNSPEVFLVNRDGSAEHLPDFSLAKLLSLDPAGLVTMTDSGFRKAVSQQRTYSSLLQCQGSVFVPTYSGLLKTASTSTQSSKSFPLTQAACAQQRTAASPQAVFLKTLSSPRIYSLSQGRLSWISSMDEVKKLAQTSSPQIFSTSEGVISELASS